MATRDTLSFPLFSLHFYFPLRHIRVAYRGVSKYKRSYSCTPRTLEERLYRCGHVCSDHTHTWKHQGQPIRLRGALQKSTLHCIRCQTAKIHRDALQPLVDRSL